MNYKYRSHFSILIRSSFWTTIALLKHTRFKMNVLRPLTLILLLAYLALDLGTTEASTTQATSPVSASIAAGVTEAPSSTTAAPGTGGAIKGTNTAGGTSGGGTSGTGGAKNGTDTAGNSAAGSVPSSIAVYLAGALLFIACKLT